MRLNGKVAIITGAARGQGAAEARLFAREGAKVVLGDVLDEEGTRVAAEIAEFGGAAVFVHLDVTVEHDWQRAIQTAVSSFGTLNVLVNNAAIWRRGVVLETSVEDWDAILDVNAKGVFLGSRLVIPEMTRAGGGSIVNIASTGGIVGSKTGSAYSASKGAVLSFTRTTAVQYGVAGIRANSICPGPIDTVMYEQVNPGVANRAASVARTLLGRMGTSEDVAYGALYLASDESGFVTGSALVIDGGVTAQ